MTLAGGGVITNDVLKMGKIIEFQSSWIVNSIKLSISIKFIFVSCYIQPICAGELLIGTQVI